MARNIVTVATDYKEQEIGETETIVQKGRKGKATEGWFYRPVLKIRFRNLFPQISRIIINGVWTFLEGRLKFFNELLEFIEYTFDKFVSFVENHND